MRHNKKVVVLSVMCMLVLYVLSPMAAFAEEPIDMNWDSTLRIEYRYDNTPIEGAVFKVYRVADVSAGGTSYWLSGNFASYPVVLNGLDNESFQFAAQTLAGYAMLDEISPDATLTTDQEGIASSMNFKPGLYLILGEWLYEGEGAYVSMPVLVQLPASDEESEDGWNYNLTVVPKSKFIKIGEHPVSRKVLKVWDDQGYENERPEEIEVCLLCDGKLYGTVKLNAENNWRHTWSNLSGRNEWTMVEKTEQGYTVLACEEGITTVITNTYEENEEPSEPTKPTDPSEPTKPTEPSESTEPTKPSDATEPSEPSKSTEPTDSTKPTTPSKPQLPQTGMLWWPVPLLVALGLVLIVVGCVLRKGERYDA